MGIKKVQNRVSRKSIFLGAQDQAFVSIRRLPAVTLWDSDLFGVLKHPGAIDAAGEWVYGPVSRAVADKFGFIDSTNPRTHDGDCGL